MKLNIKNLAVNMDVGTPGIEIAVKDNDGKHQGDFHVTKAGIVWCKGKTLKKSGKKMTWKKIIDMMDEK